MPDTPSSNGPPSDSPPAPPGGVEIGAPSAMDAPSAVSRYEPPSVLAARERRSAKLLMTFLRLIFMVMLVSVSLLTVASMSSSPTDFDTATMLGVFLASTAVGVIVLLLDARFPNKKLTSMVGVYVGICVGLILALAIGALVDVVAQAWDLKDGRVAAYLGMGKVMVGIVLCYLAVSVVLTTKDDFRLVIPYVEFSKQVRGIRPMLLDTSALIDGRIEGLGQTGFLDAPLLVPEFVIEELQRLADSGDKLKRARGRRGLDLLPRLQANPYIDVSIDDTTVAGHSVDQMLLQLAKDQNLRILTTDYNLNKVAQIKGVTVLNINDLGNSVRSQAIPGESITVEIVKHGEGASQGVGYMPDGTMVVVEDAGNRIGQSMLVTVTNSLQTSAGRMIFAKPSDSIASSTAAGTYGAGQSSPVEQMARSATSQPRTPVRSVRVEDPTDAGSRRNPRR